MPTVLSHDSSIFKPVGITATVALYLFGIVFLYSAHVAGVSNLWYFVSLYFLHLFLLPPTRTISPASVLYGYYGLWFIVAPIFAKRYEDYVFTLPEYTLAIVLAYSVFGSGLIALYIGEFAGARQYLPKMQKVEIDEKPQRRLQISILVLYAIASVAVMMIVISSGGLAKWIADPGDAFLNRGGSGIYVIISHFSAFALAAISGYYTYVRGSKLPIVSYLIWLAITSPVHGSKLHIATLGIVLFMPWLSKLRPLSFKSIIFYFFLAFVFFLGMYFRGLTWEDMAFSLPYVLNYFSALENLAFSIRDFDPGFITTFFLPFVKFLTPFGLAEPNMYFDMNHMLTDHYYPEAWEIRATEQWPVETDLYLNFYFICGLPLVAGYFYIVGFLHGRAHSVKTLGWIFVSTLMSVWMISHLRGSLYNHTDFYQYPYLILMFLLFKNFYLEDPAGQSNSKKD